MKNLSFKTFGELFLYISTLENLPFDLEIGKFFEGTDLEYSYEIKTWELKLNGFDFKAEKETTTSGEYKGEISINLYAKARHSSNDVYVRIASKETGESFVTQLNGIKGHTAYTLLNGIEASENKVLELKEEIKQMERKIWNLENAKFLNF